VNPKYRLSACSHAP